MRKNLPTFFFVISTIAVSAQSFSADYQQLENLHLLKVCEECDLSGVNLKYADLKNAVLKNSNLEGDENRLAAEDEHVHARDVIARKTLFEPAGASNKTMY